MITGRLNLGSITDKGMEEIIRTTEQQPQIIFQPGQVQEGPTGNPPITIWNGVVLSWKDAAGLKALADLLNRLAEIG